MKTKITISELSQEDLANLLETATYGSNGLDYEIPNEMAERYLILADEECYNERAAKVLAEGGYIDIINLYSLEDELRKNDKVTDASKYVLWTHIEPYTYQTWTGKYARGYVSVYRINKDSILKALNEVEDAAELVADMYLREDYDRNTADGLLQCVIFGEQVYG